MGCRFVRRPNTTILRRGVHAETTTPSSPHSHVVLGKCFPIWTASPAVETSLSGKSKGPTTPCDLQTHRAARDTRKSGAVGKSQLPFLSQRSFFRAWRAKISHISLAFLFFFGSRGLHDHEGHTRVARSRIRMCIHSSVQNTPIHVLEDSTPSLTTDTLPEAAKSLRRPPESGATLQLGLDRTSDLVEHTILRTLPGSDADWVGTGHERCGPEILIMAGSHFWCTISGGPRGSEEGVARAWQR